MVDIEIDSNSGFCFGVVNAICKAEEELEKSGSLHCLGDIVHNSDEMERLRARGLASITHEDLAHLEGGTVLLRAHGEPPSTYAAARARNIEIIDATCPVVLQLQRRIKAAYDAPSVDGRRPLILIYGKEGHAEVNGLVGQTAGEAIVIQSVDELDAVDLDRDVILYSQTTKSRSGYQEIIDAIRARKRSGSFRYFDTICRQVANRMEGMRAFAASKEAVIFVCGKKSSNGKVLYNECRRVNPRTYMISNAGEIDAEWTKGVRSIGICGATSTPSWQMEDVKRYLEQMLNGKD